MERVATMERIAMNILVLRDVNRLFFVAFVTFLLNFPSLCGEISSVTASTSNRFGF